MDESTQLDNAIKTKDVTMERVLGSYFPDDAGTSLYEIFTKWGKLGFNSFMFFRMKTYWSNQIMVTYQPFKTAVDDLLPILNGLVLGTKTRPECQTMGAKAVALQETSYKAICEYFSVEIP